MSFSRGGAARSNWQIDGQARHELTHMLHDRSRLSVVIGSLVVRYIVSPAILEVGEILGDLGEKLQSLISGLALRERLLRLPDCGVDLLDDVLPILDRVSSSLSSIMALSRGRQHLSRCADHPPVCLCSRCVLCGKASR